VNYDDYLDLAEAKGHEMALGHFEAGDLAPNKDQYLTPDELLTTADSRNALIAADTANLATAAAIEDSNKGFATTDIDNDKKISPSEDTRANMVADEFNSMNSDAADGDTELTKTELNRIYPMWEVDEILSTYDTNTNDKLDVNEYADQYYAKYSPEDKCTKMQIKDGGPVRIDSCSSTTDCWEQVDEDYVAKNSKCDRAYESCAVFSNVSTGPYYSCILTSYCGQTYDSNKLVWGLEDRKIVGTIDCTDGEKEDPNQTRLQDEAQARATKKDEDANDNNMLIVAKGKKCTKKGDGLTPAGGAAFFDTAAACFDQAKLKTTGCNFFMYSTDYPVEGCYCCD